MERKMSKIALCYFMACLAIVLTACVPGRQVAVLVPVGPPPFAQAGQAPEGDLVVYSASDTGGPGDPDGCIHHSDYRICSAEGKQFKYVNNWIGTFIQDPAVVSLPSGRYSVVARASADGTVTVPVIIEAGKTTSVHLDGSKPPDGRKGAESELVRLPDGRIVGWRARTDNGDN
jgi:hypothetical protein